MPGQDSGAPQIRVNPLPNPLSLDYQVGFNFFASWWRVDQSIKEDKERAKIGGRRPVDRVSKTESREEREKERAQIQAAYDTYKEELQARMARAFVQQHKAEEWFKERYSADLREPLVQNLIEYRKSSALVQWNQDIEAGIFDDFTLEGIYKTESNGAGGVIEREEGETVAAAEVLGVGDLVPSRGGDIRDDTALQPALLIKTLAPMVSREKLESFCKEHLSEEAGGFRWLSLSDPNPQKKYHRIGWIMLHPGEPQEPTPMERSDGRDEEGEKADADEEAGKGTVLSTAAKALDAVNGKIVYDEARGDFTCHVGVHVPPREPRKKALWDLFSAPERIERDVELAKRLVVKFDDLMGDAADGVAQVQDRVNSLRERGLLQALSGSSGGKKCTENSGDHEMHDLDDDDHDEGEEMEEDDVDNEELLMQKKTLDILVEYLRRVYNFCFFCVFESDSVHELVRKCPGGHLRRPRASLSSAAKAAARASALGEPFPLKPRDSTSEEAAVSPVEEKQVLPRGGNKNDQQLQRAFNWVKTFEEKLLQLLEPENVDVRKLGGIPMEEGIEEELKKFVKQEDESKFRCKVPDCTKLFKGEVFWRKHVEKRHPEWYGNIQKEVRDVRLASSLECMLIWQITLINTYILDPSHIAPSRSDANSNGHFPMNNQHMASGTPRGFNLAGMPPMNGAFGFPGQPNVMGASFPNFGNHIVQMPGNGWNGGNGIDDASAIHQVGPVRRGGRNQGRPGPYDRRQPKYGNTNGMAGIGMGMATGAGLSIGSGGGMGNGSMGRGEGKWSDGGAQAVGPREAVQGRSLKSYEDLDAVAGEGGGELNY